MQTSPATQRAVGLGLGAVLLGLLVVLAVALPKVADADDDTGAGQPAIELTLPDTLPGGYAAADDPASFADGQLAPQADAIAESEKAGTAYGNEVLPEVLGTAAVTRSYVGNGTDPVFVQAFQAPGGAFAPTSLTDPAASGGQGGTTMEKVGDGVCILSYAQAQMGATDAAPANSQCQVAHGDLTVQITSGVVAADELVELADGLLDELSGATQDQ